MPRSKQSQSKHDNAVRKAAESLEQQGFNVKADIKDYPQPDTIGGVRPDVVATKPGQKLIVEVETKDSVGTARDQNQQKQFQNAANRSSSTVFTRIVV